MSDDEAGHRGHRLEQSQHGARRSVPRVLGTAELAARLAGFDLVVRRHLGRPDVTRVSPGYGAVVFLIKRYQKEVSRSNPPSSR